MLNLFLKVAHDDITKGIWYLCHVSEQQIQPGVRCTCPLLSKRREVVCWRSHPADSEDSAGLLWDEERFVAVTQLKGSKTARQTEKENVRFKK